MGGWVFSPVEMSEGLWQSVPQRWVRLANLLKNHWLPGRGVLHEGKAAGEGFHFLTLRRKGGGFTRSCLILRTVFSDRSGARDFLSCVGQRRPWNKVVLQAYKPPGRQRYGSSHSLRKKTIVSWATVRKLSLFSFWERGERNTQGFWDIVL